MRIESNDDNQTHHSRATRIPAIVFLVLLLIMARVCTAQGINTSSATESLSVRMDRRFADWNKPTSPGCAIAIVKNGKIVYKQGYGMANLEYGIRNTPSTIFHVASLAKQFTAFAIHLLAQEGKLSLDDDVRKYLPKLHDFGQTITLRHLLHHTSGLRDQFDLLQLAGWRLSDVITEQDVLGLIWRQRELNFAPGAEHLYCNTGYTLLAVIVKRVSGKSLREFTQERIFTPLGMKHTQFHDDYQALIQNRAYSYQWTQETGYQNVPHAYSTVGSTGLFTTVEDLALWDQNFYDGRVGGQAVLAEMLKPGKLKDGKELDYASGLGLGAYRGLKTVSHEGRDAGFRADLLRFPQKRVSILFLANTDAFNPVYMTHQIADIYLEGQLEPILDGVKTPAANKPIEVERPVLTPEQMQTYTGAYYSEELGVLYTVTARDGSLLLRYPRGEVALQTTLPDTFATPNTSPIGTIRYTRNTDKAITGFTINTSRVRNLRFVKTEIKPIISPVK